MKQERNREKDLRLLRRWDRNPPKSLTSRYAHHYLKQLYGEGARIHSKDEEGHPKG